MPDYKTANRHIPRGLRPRSLMEYRVAGLRDWEEPTEVRVYNAFTSEFLRIEQPTTFNPNLNHNRRQKI